MAIAPHDVVDFWFGAPGSPERGLARDVWFRKDPAFDDTIRARFGVAIAQALQGAFVEWDSTPDGALARIVLLDQFSRNVFRDTPRAFAGDALALAAADAAVARGFDRALDTVQRGFVYLPFEHAEDAAMQHRSLALFGALARETGDDSLLQWARRHADVIFRFGRYPHRNEILGRTSTPEEIAFLREPGSRF
ncbi:MAG: DUF924 family protein [Burkholderiales bacterium]